MKKKLASILLTCILVIAISSTSFAGRDLMNGTSGDDVYTLQQVLAAYGYLQEAPTGYFGSATAAALASLQYDLGLTADGIAGPVTRSYLGIASYDDSYYSYGTGYSYDAGYSYGTATISTSLSKGMSGSDVYTLQQLLAAYGYFYEEPSGYFGDATEAAVMNLQYDFGLEVCGIVGPQTIALLTGSYPDTSSSYNYYADYAAAVLAAIDVTPSAASGYCASWVTNVMMNAGILSSSLGYNANDYWANVCYSSDINDLQPGMIIATRNSYSYLGQKYGHVGIYIGDGMVISSIGYLETISLEAWISKYNNAEMGSTARWGYLS